LLKGFQMKASFYVRILIVSLCAAVIGITLAGCQPAQVTTPQAGDVQQEVELTVFAASSLTDAFTEIGQVFEEQNAGVKVAFNFASSSDLALQLSEGAQADVFASANQKQMDKASDAGRIGEEIKLFVTNRLVVIVPADNPAGIQAPIDLAKEGIKLVLAAPDVPVRDYTEEALDKMGADPAYGDGFKAAVLANLVSEEANVRQVVTKVSLGEADAGIVYTSDVTPDVAETILGIEIPDEFNIIASYPVAVIKDAPNAATAKAFVDFIMSQEGQTILQKWGFGPAPIE
jgi:molybdate transport system substrate-binding protein